MFTHCQGYHSHNRRAKLEKRRVYARNVPHELKMKQKQDQTASCQDLYIEKDENLFKKSLQLTVFVSGIQS